MLQEQKPLEQAGNKGTSQALKDELEALKNTEVQAVTRTVIPKAESCCACGCSDIKIKRIVPWNSPLKDGDHIGRETLPGDKLA